MPSRLSTSKSPAPNPALSDAPAKDLDTSTRARLLAAAGAVFAEHGYENATVRQICVRAGANVAAVNYHFGDKAGLYAAVMDWALDSAMARHRLEDASNASPEQRLTNAIAFMLRKLLDPNAPVWYSAIMAREMVQPTFALDRMVDRMARPLFMRLRSIISELIAPSIQQDSPYMLDRLTASVIGQCLIYKHGKEVNARIRPHEPYTHEMVEEWAIHIARFSLAAIKTYESTVPPKAHSTQLLTKSTPNEDSRP